MLQKYPFQPGIIKDDPPLTSEGFWGDGNNVRFYRGKPEPVKGWELLVDEAVTGKARRLVNWSSLIGTTYLGIGTTTKLEVVEAENLFDITPIDATGAAFSFTVATTDTLAVVTLTHAAHGRAAGDTIYLSNMSSPIGGITLDGTYIINTVPTSSTYTITHTAAATSTVSAARTIDYIYELSTTNEIGISAFGWGSGGYGEDTYGTERTSGAISLFPRTWSLEGFGEELLAVPYGGKLYVWDGNTGNRAVAEAAAPTLSDNMFVTPERFVVLLGTKDYGTSTYNPMLVRWAEQETYDSWTPTATNTAGEYPLSVGNRVMAGTASKLQNLIWTDTALYAMRYLGDTEFVYGFDLLGQNCGLASPMGFAQRDGVAFWISPIGQFFMYDGGAPRVIPCPVRRYVFDDINFQQFRIISCGLDSEYNEVIWWYCSYDSFVIDKYVSYNYVDNVWTIGDISRTAWLDKSLYERSIGVDNDGYIFLHNTGTSGNGAAISAYIETAPFDLADGDTVMNIRRIVPDLDITGTLDITLTTKRWPNDVTEQTKTLSFADTETRIDTRAQGRVAKIRFGSDGIGDTWRLGDIRLDVDPVSRR